jgi:uncharacterized protein
MRSAKPCVACLRSSASVPRGYTPQVTGRVYRTLTERAALAVKAGHSVIVDAVFARPTDRAAMEDLATAASVPFAGIWLDAPLDVLLARTEGRRLDPSDADASVVRQQLALGTGPIRWHRVDGARREASVLAEVQAQIAAVPGPERVRMGACN